MSDIPHVPERCFKCGKELVGRQSHSFLTGIGANVGFGLVIVALLSPNWTMRIVGVLSGVALLIYSYLSHKDRQTGFCSECIDKGASGGDGASSNAKAPD